MKAYLELKEVPESCWQCPIVDNQCDYDRDRYYCHQIKSGDTLNVSYFCNSRHPGCPLIIKEENNDD